MFNSFFDYPNFGETGAPRGSTMIALGREVILSIQTTLVSGTVWPQFVMQVLTGGCQPQFGGKQWSYGVGDGFAE